VQQLQDEAGFHDTLLLAVSVCYKCPYKFPILSASRRACQKEDWRNHKKNCGKKKVSKKLRGTIHDPLWAYPDVPEYMHDAPIESRDGHFDITSAGFPGPNHTRQCSPALQRQISILTADKDADYYLFDEADQPVRIVLYDGWTKLNFRQLRLGAWSDDSHLNSSYMAAIGQYLVKYWGSRPGLSRETILKQFDKEYGEGATAKIEDFEKKSAEKGNGEETFLEEMARGMKSMPIPRM
jgi:hypothetical protein